MLCLHIVSMKLNCSLRYVHIYVCAWISSSGWLAMKWICTYKVSRSVYYSTQLIVYEHTYIGPLQVMEVLCQIWINQNPVASPSTRMISGITLFRCEMYRWHFPEVTVLQNWRIPFTSSSLVFGFTSLRMNSCIINKTMQSCGSVYKQT